MLRRDEGSGDDARVPPGLHTTKAASGRPSPAQGALTGWRLWMRDESDLRKTVAARVGTQQCVATAAVATPARTRKAERQ
ncbi:MAG: hypothetical protein NVS3B26_18220 [Mycobacteriales bacterium]